MDKENVDPNLNKKPAETGTTDVYAQKTTAQKKFDKLTQSQKDAAAKKYALGPSVKSVARGRRRSKARKSRKSKKSRKTKRRQRR